MLSIIAALISMFGPYIMDLVIKLLKKWFSEVEPTLMAMPIESMEPKQVINNIFDELESVVPRIHLGRRLLLRIMRRISLRHAPALVAGQLDINLDQEDKVELALASRLARRAM